MSYSDDGDRKKQRRKSINLRIDPDKHEVLEDFRTSGFGFAKTKRNRSDVYNEAIGYGIQTMMLRKQIGEKEFNQVWKIINNMDLQKLNLDKISSMFAEEK